MPRLNESTTPSSESDVLPSDFEDFAKQLLINGIRVMIRCLQESGEFTISDVQLEDLGLRRRKYLKRELRNTL